MKKIIMILELLVVILFLFPNITYAEDGQELSTEAILESQQDSLNISSFLKEAQKYTSSVYDDINMGELFTSALTGKIDNEKILKAIISIFGKEIVSSINVLGSVIIIIVIHSILKSISEGLENKSISHITYYVQYILIVTLIMTNFVQVVTMVKESVQNLVGFMDCLIPVLMTLVLTTGSIASASMLQPILLFIITFIGNFINSFILPLVLVSTALGIVSKISERVQVDRLSKFFKSSVVWILGVILTLFVGLVSLEGTLSSNVDGITAKTTKAAVSSFIPVVGKILGDAVDAVIGCSSILKNALGIIGVVVIIGICIAPIIKLTILMIIYYLGAAVCQPIADERIIKLLEQMGDTFKTLLAILSSISVMLIIGVTLVVKISNSGLMYR